MSRPGISDARRLVVKIGSSSLTESSGGLARERVLALVEAVVGRRDSGAEIVMVSSGAIAAGLDPLGLYRRPQDLATLQAASTVGQSLLVGTYAIGFARHGIAVGQVLLTAEDVMRRAHYRNAQRTLERLLSLGAVPIINENDAVATEEIRFGDNDRLAALVAHLVSADGLVILSDVDGLYDGDPRRGEAELVEVVAGEDDLTSVRLGRTGSAVGTGGMASKVAAARTATQAGVAVVLTSTARAVSALAGEPVGTYFVPTGRRHSSRLLWLAHASAPTGRLYLDAGAVAAVVERGASLLAAGITGVEGEFAAGDPVDIVGPEGHRVGRGLVGYDATEMPMLLGRSTHQLGPGHQREVVHRDDLVLLPREVTSLP
jgi:glutamate 5-kinase